MGTVLGGGAGLLAGLGMLAIPGVGPVVAAGWLVATVVGGGTGAASGGLLGSLLGAGMSEPDAHLYAEGLRRGGTMVTALVDDEQRQTVETILSRHSGVDAVTRETEYRASGWEGSNHSTIQGPGASVISQGLATTARDVPAGNPGTTPPWPKRKEASSGKTD